MRTCRILAATLAMALTAHASNRLLACGGYGTPADPILLAAIGDDPTAAGKAIAALRTQGASAITQVNAFLNQTRRQEAMYDNWLAKDAENWMRFSHQWSEGIRAARLQNNIRIAETREALRNQTIRLQNLLAELSRVG